MKFIKDFIRDENGLTMIEYAIAGGVIALGASAAFTSVGTNIKAKLDGVFS